MRCRRQRTHERTNVRLTRVHLLSTQAAVYLKQRQSNRDCGSEYLDEHWALRRDRDAPRLGGGVVHGARIAAVHADRLDPVRWAAAGDAVACAPSFSGMRSTQCPALALCQGAVLKWLSAQKLTGSWCHHLWITMLVRSRKCPTLTLATNKCMASRAALLERGHSSLQLAATTPGVA